MKRHAFPLAVTAALAAALLAGCGDDEPADADDPAGTAAPEDTSEPPATPDEPATTSSAPADTTSDAAATVEVPVYFVGETPQGPRLFAEVRAVEADDPLEGAAALVTSGDAEDPDYTTLFPGGAIASVEVVDQTFVVEVGDDGWSTPPPGTSRREARLAVQQLVYTLQAAEGQPYPLVVQSGGSAVPLFGVDTEGGVKAAEELDVRGLVNVLSPAEGAEVSGTFTAEGESSSFEATVGWEVRDAQDRVVAEGFATAEGWIDRLHPWTAEIDVSRLAPGEYTFVARTDDPSAGEGPGPTEDTKTIVVG